jgi:23S rRNA G2445 N2-methylase RlmL
VGQPLTIVAATAFGTESVVKRELAAMGIEAGAPNPGRVEFEGVPRDVARTNLWLRSASRVMVLLGRFPCADFDQLYEGVRAIDWATVLPPGAKIIVRARSVRSTINSPRSAQSITKRAIVDALAGRGGLLAEDGPPVIVDAAVLRDEASICIDTSGDALHKRGYRPRSGPGQLKETLAAAIVQMTGWRGDRPLIDPFCGQGTIVIEAAMIAAGIAPGLRRGFAGEALVWIDPVCWAEARADAESVRPPSGLPQLLGRDVDPYAVAEARRAAERAGVRGIVGFRTDDFHDIVKPAERGWVITNPPYGLRVLDHPEATRIHRDLPGVLARLPGWSHAILTAYEGFEELIRQQASKRRKLYNGSIRCDLFIFRPQRGPAGERRSFGSTTDRDAAAEMFAAALRKRVRHLRRWPERRGTDSYRLYDGQATGAPISVDRYGEHLLVRVPMRRSDRPVGDEDAWIDRLCMIVAAETATPPERVHRLIPGRGTDVAPAGVPCIEDGMRVDVALPPQPSEGFRLDLREIRRTIRRWAEGRRVLLIGSGESLLPVSAAMGDAAFIYAVEPSAACAARLSRLFAQNGIPRTKAEVAADDAESALGVLARTGTVFDLVALELPGRGPGGRGTSDTLRRMHQSRLMETAASRLLPMGRLMVTTPGRRIWIDSATLDRLAAREITGRTTPEDFTHSQPHRAWMVHAPSDGEKER